MKMLTVIMTIYLAITQIKPLTEEEVQTYLQHNRIQAVDYKLINDTTAIILEIDGPRASAHKICKQSDHSIVEESEISSWEEDEDGISVKSDNVYLYVVIHEKAVRHDIEFFNINYFDGGNMQKDRFELNHKRGALVERSSKYKGGGTVSLYGSDGFIGEAIFY
ncbi:hypothetical protein [Paenibacillus riograndensis]|uniref:Uncharacterized protein n=2 Tax=Paenibacillus riograndensis TaxID=483937 RepID=A0A0E4H8T9_9BACL|nr:hypothetical protein [Paenibacillus riograndensis]CQR53988.1 hypothetical protein PRIO_1661 [Paenibacillus riograndensis SBR5]